MSEIKQAQLLRLATSLALVGLLWHFVEAGAGFYLGSELDSPTLRGFALDSGVEILAGGILMLRLWGLNLSERRAGRLIGVTFLLIAAWILFDAVASFISPSAQGSVLEERLSLLLAGVVIVTMYPLAYFKSRVAGELHSDAARAESRQTYLCAHMAWLLLLGVLGPMVGLPLLDGIAALAIAALALYEARQSFKSGPCGCALHVDGVDYRSLRRVGRLWVQDLSPEGQRVYRLRWPLTGALVALAALGVDLGAELIFAGLALVGLLVLWVGLLVLRERAEVKSLS